MLQGFYSGRDWKGALLFGAMFFASAMLFSLGMMRLLAYIDIEFYHPAFAIGACALSALGVTAVCLKTGMEVGSKLRLSILSVLVASVLIYMLVA